MISNLKQGTEGLSVSKTKVSRKELVAEPTPVGKRTARNVQTTSPRRSGLTVSRVFSRADVKPFDELEWERRTAEITDDSGKTIFRQDHVEVPKGWSVLATKVVVSKYFYGENGTSEREHSARQLVHRVTRTIADWGKADGYFASEKDAETFYSELTWLCINQYGSFNSPVWFNCGLYHEYGIGKQSGPGNFYYDRATKTVRQATTQYEYPQCSACFIQAVGDRMEDIMELARSEEIGRASCRERVYFSV